MAINVMENPFNYFTDSDGRALDAGFVYIGLPNLDPETNPVNIYWDYGLTVPARNPVRTTAGYPSRNGSPGTIYVDGDYSIVVKNKSGELVYSSLSAQGLVGSDLVTYILDDANAVSRTVQERLRERLSVADFGAVGDGATDDTAAFQNAIDAASSLGVDVEVPWTSAGYLISTINLPRTNVHLKASAMRGRTDKVKITHSSPTGNMFQVNAPVSFPYSLRFTGVYLQAHAAATTSMGVFIDTSSFAAFSINFTDVLIDGFNVGIHCQQSFWNRMERVAFDNCHIGYYGGASVANTFIDCEPRTIPANGIGIWTLGTKATFIGGDTGSGDSGTNAIQYRVGIDNTNYTAGSPEYTANIPVVATNIEGHVTFYNTHFEFSDGAGAGTVQKAFVDIMAGSSAVFEKCHFQNRTPNLPQAIYCWFLSDNMLINRCIFDLGTATIGPGNGSYATAEVVVNNSASGRGIEIVPDTIGSVPAVSGVTTSNAVGYSVRSGVRAGKNAVQTVANNALDQITFTVEAFDYNNEFVTNVFTALYPGTYSIQSTVTIGGTNPPVAGARYRLELRKNGAAASRSDYVAVNAFDMSLKLDDDLILAAGDTLDIYLLNNNSGANIDIYGNTARTFITIKKIG